MSDREMSIGKRILILSLLATSFCNAELRMNEVQALGTHNSYHKESVANLWPAWKYTHKSLTEQLNYGVRQIELDIHLNVNGRFYVHHIEQFDPHSSCDLFKDCLAEIRNWSVAHPQHMPLLIWVEIKDKDYDKYLPTWKKISPHFSDLDNLIKNVFPTGSLIMPAEIKGAANTLSEAVQTKGWPELNQIRGKIIFGMIGSDDDYKAYFGQSVSLVDKIFFPRATNINNPLAAIFKPDDAVKDFQLIQDLVKKGFLVTTMADTPEATDAENSKQAEMALKAGAQFVSTNYTYPQNRRSYWFSAIQKPVCNPILSPTSCTVE